MNKIIFCLSFIICWCVQSVIIQHDTPVEAYKNFAQNPMFDAVGRLQINNVLCTGVLIDERTVLTTRHCVTGFNQAGSKTFSLSTKWHTGNNQLLDDDFTVMGVRQPAEYKVNPPQGFDADFFITAQDLAIVYLDNPVFMNAFPRLATSPLPPQDIKGKQGYIAGYGQFGYAHRQGSDNSIGRLAGITQISTFRHYVHHHHTLPFVTINTSFTHQGAGQCGAGTMKGDSGGPLFIVDAQGSSMLAGLASRVHYKYSPKDALNYLAALKIASNLDIQLFKTEAPLQFHQDRFLGYQTEQFYTYTGGFHHFISHAKAMIEAISLSAAQPGGARYWSDINAWQLNTSRLWPPILAIDNTYNQDRLGLLPSFFKVIVGGFLVADINAKTESIVLNNFSSNLHILHGVTIISDRAVVEQGAKVQVDGVLYTKRLTLRQGTVSGQGTIRFFKGPNPNRSLLEGEPAGAFFNHAGVLNLAEHGLRLVVEGDYVHGHKAAFDVRIGEYASSLLEVKNQVRIDGGTLNIHLGALPTFPVSSSKTWTIVTADSITGQFNNITIDDYGKNKASYSCKIIHKKNSIEIILTRLM